MFQSEILEHCEAIMVPQRTRDVFHACRFSQIDPNFCVKFFGIDAAAGIAFINCFGKLGGLLGPVAMGGQGDWKLPWRPGLSWFIAAMLLIALPKGTEPLIDVLRTQKIDAGDRQ
jgi:hypothetical protein